jgi:zinc transport system substrate-binding protein
MLSYNITKEAEMAGFGAWPKRAAAAGRALAGKRPPVGHIRLFRGSAAAGLLALGLGLLAAAGPLQAAQDAPSVVVSIKPIHALVASVMAGVAEPDLIVEGNASPHAWTLKPSQAAALAEADLVVWVGEGLESYLAAPMQSLVPAGHGLELADLPSIGLLPVREGGVWEPHHHEGEEHADDEHVEEEHAEEEHAEGEHAHGGYDPHLWLDPQNAIAIATSVAARLVELDPAHADAYGANLAALTDRLERLDAETAARLAPLRDRPFIVFHDAYQYFEHRYGLAGAGSITLDPEQTPGAARLAAVRERLAAGGIVCAFAEPLFDQSLLETAVEGSGVRIATLDPEGVDLAPGPELYFELVGHVADTMANCLSAQN